MSVINVIISYQEMVFATDNCFSFRRKHNIVLNAKDQKVSDGVNTLGKEKAAVLYICYSSFNLNEKCQKEYNLGTLIQVLSQYKSI